MAGALATTTPGCETVVEPATPAGRDPVTLSLDQGHGFSFPTLDGVRLSKASVKGRMTVIVFATTYDIPSQAQARFLNEVFHRHVPRINAVLLVLEPPHHRPLVEAYRDSLRLDYTVAMADEATIAGDGAFEGLHHVPAIVLLDRDGVEKWRHLGLLDAKALHAVIDRFDR